MNFDSLLSVDEKVLNLEANLGEGGRPTEVSIDVQKQKYVETIPIISNEILFNEIVHLVRNIQSGCCQDITVHSLRIFNNSSKYYDCTTIHIEVQKIVSGEQVDRVLLALNRVLMEKGEVGIGDNVYFKLDYPSESGVVIIYDSDTTNKSVELNEEESNALSDLLDTSIFPSHYKVLGAGFSYDEEVDVGREDGSASVSFNIVIPYGLSRMGVTL